MTLMDKIQSIDMEHKELSVRQQCDLLDLNRSTLYYEPEAISEEKLYTMNLIDELYTEQPSRGHRQMTLALTDYDVYLNKKTVLAYMQEMGIRSISPGPHTSVPNIEHKIYPYLLRGYLISRPLQVWASDITYIRMKGRYAYLVAILDWYSRFIVSWRLSYSMSTDFCLEALNDALKSGIPYIFNTDQGSQFTSEDFTDTLNEMNIKISMDGKGSYWDNIFTERLWRTLKHDEVYPREYRDLEHAITSLSSFIEYYNNRRHHSSLENYTPFLIHNEIVVPRPKLSTMIQ
jgi:putative transposase